MKKITTSLKLCLIAFFSLLIFLSSDTSVAARSCVDELNLQFKAGTQLPPSVGTQYNQLDFTLTGFAPSQENEKYSLVLVYASGLKKTIENFTTGNSNTSRSFTINQTNFPEAFFMPPEVYKSSNRLDIVKTTSNGGTITCQLWEYNAYSSPMSPTNTVCGDAFSLTRNKRGEAGGCVDQYVCSTAISKGWWCECDDQCKAAGGGSLVVGSTIPGSSTQTGNNNQTIDDSQTGGGTQTGSNNQYVDDSQTGGSNNTTGVPAGANRTDTTVNTDSASADDPGLDVFNNGPTESDFAELNPLKNSSAQLKSPGGIVSRALQFAFPLAGLILFIMIVWGGFEMLIGATGKGIEAGRQRVTNAIVGFLALFVAYWIFQIIEYIFKIQIL